MGHQLKIYDFEGKFFLTLHFKKLYKDMEKRYPQYCDYVAEELTEMANEWLQDCEDDSETATPITKKEFADRI